MSSVLITIFLLLSCFIEKIYSKPLNEGKNEDNKSEDNKNETENEGNTTLKIFLIIVALFILGSVLYCTQSFWLDPIKESWKKNKKATSKSTDTEISERTFENIEFDSFNFTEVNGMSKLSIDITNIIEKYIDSSKDESSIIDINSLSQSNIPKPENKTSLNINSSSSNSQNVESYNAFENELNNLKTQEITDIKLPVDTSYIENTPSFINEESTGSSKKILIGINNIEVVPNIDTKSLKNNEALQESIEQEKCESLKSKKSEVSSKKSHLNESEETDESDNADNSGLNINDEKTLINKSLKPLVDEDTTNQEIDEDSHQDQELNNDNQDENSIHSKKDDKAKESSEIKIEIQSENQKMESSVEELNQKMDESSISIIPEDPPSLSPVSPNSSGEMFANMSISKIKEDNLSVKSFEEETSITHVGAKIDPITINDDSMSSLDLGEVNSSEEIIIENTIESNVDSLEPTTTKNNEEELVNCSFTIIENHPTENEAMIKVTPPSPIQEETEEIIKITPPSPVQEPTEVKTLNILQMNEEEKPIVENANVNIGEMFVKEKIQNDVENTSENDKDIQNDKIEQTDKSERPFVENISINEKAEKDDIKEKVQNVTGNVEDELISESESLLNNDGKGESAKKIEEKLKAIQKSLESEITDDKPPHPHFDNIKPNEFIGEEEGDDDEKKEIYHPPLKLNKRTSSLNLNIKKRKESIDSNANEHSTKKGKHHKLKKQIQQSIDNEIASIANEMNNDTIKEKFNDYCERRSSIQSSISGTSTNSKRTSALSAYILHENFNDDNEKETNNLNKITNSNVQPNNFSKLTLNIDTSVDEIHPIKEDHTQDKQSQLATPSSLNPSQPHSQLRSPTPTGLPSPSVTSSSDSLRDCISPTPSEDSTVSSSSYSYSIGKVSRNKYFEVVYDHRPQLPDEIPLRKGDRVQIKQVFEDGWAYGIVKNKKKKRLDGIFPIQCLGEEIEPVRNGRVVPRLVRVYQARLEDEEQERQEEEEFKKKITDQARKNILLKLALSHPK
jgi:hypothetical protein